MRPVNPSNGLATERCDSDTVSGQALTQLVSHLVEQNPTQGAIGVERAWARQLQQGVEMPPPPPPSAFQPGRWKACHPEPPQTTPRPDTDPCAIDAYLPVAFIKSPAYSSLTNRQKHAIVDSQDAFGWFTLAGNTRFSPARPVRR